MTDDRPAPNAPTATTSATASDPATAPTSATAAEPATASNPASASTSASPSTSASASSPATASDRATVPDPVPRMDPLCPRRGPVRLTLSRAPWAATAYLAGYPLVGGLAFAGCVGALAIAVGGVAVTWLGLPLLVGVAGIVRAAATVERRRARLVGPEIEPEYRPVVGTGLLAHVRSRWRDRATRRDCAYLVGMFAPLLAMDTVALAVWLGCLAGVALPAWYWAVPIRWRCGATTHGIPLGYLPNGPGGGGFGGWIGSPPAAIGAALVFAVLSVGAAHAVVGAAAVHRAVARRQLGPYVDPLAEAKKVLDAPGPLPAVEHPGPELISPGAAQPSRGSVDSMRAR